MNNLEKWFNPTPIWSNPVGWARKVGQSRAKVIVWIFVHIAFVAFGFLSIYFLTGKIQNDNFSNQTINNQLEIMAMIPAVGTVFFVGIFLPALYMYVIYRLLLEIDKRDRVAGQSSSV
jgi:uncharacterized membrane protein